jgi:hypothetical protein
MLAHHVVWPIFNKVPRMFMRRLYWLDFSDLSQSVRSYCWRVFS